MKNLIERLRIPFPGIYYQILNANAERREAADEIERLKLEHSLAHDDWQRSFAEIERLRGVQHD